MSIEAMKQALQALDLIDKDIEWHDKSPTRKFCNQAAHLLRQAIEQAEKTTVDCNTCENRGVLIPLAQETYCENCIYGSPWKKNYYKEKNT
jgi:hypothetical protein